MVAEPTKEPVSVKDFFAKPAVAKKAVTKPKVVKAPRPKPVNSNYTDFIMSGAKEGKDAEGDVNKCLSDTDVVNEIMAKNAGMMNVLQQRLGTVQMLLYWWEEGTI